MTSPPLLGEGELTGFTTLMRLALPKVPAMVMILLGPVMSYVAEDPCRSFAGSPPEKSCSVVHFATGVAAEFIYKTIT
jgi:hypothetical protein